MSVDSVSNPSNNALEKPHDNDSNSHTQEKSNPSLGHVVASHYNNLGEKGLSERNQSRILHMRNFNNFIKSFLLQKHMDDIRQSLPNEHRIVALDVGCGKGGDLLKWSKANIRHLICVDIAETSVEQCRDRYDSSKSNRNRAPNYTAEFIVADCTKVCFQPLLKDPSMKVHIVSCQFAFHYCFESLSQAETMIKNVSSNLKIGGYFVLTVPDSNAIMKRLSKSGGRSFGNEVYRIEFPEDRPETPPLFGDRYQFYLEGVVDCPEFLVHLPTLKRICNKYGLECVYQKRFSDVYEKARLDDQCKHLLHRMSALETYPSRMQSSRTEGEYDVAKEHLKQTGRETVMTLSASEWEAVNLYSALGFKKVQNMSI